MRSLSRAGVGLAIGGAALALLFATASVLNDAWIARSAAESALKPPRERAYSVHVDVLTPETVAPIITTYGHLVSGRTLELRAAVAGRLVHLTDNFRDGGMVQEGELLWSVDPAKLQTAVALAETDLAEATAGVAEAASALELAKLEAAAAAEQLDLRTQAAERQQGLRDRGVATAADVEAAGLAKSAAEQTLLNRRQVVAGDEAKLSQARILLSRREIALQEARRALADAELRAPFAGVLSDVTANAGGLVSTNERLGALIDPQQIEVAFRVTGAQFARVLNDSGALRKAAVEVLVERGRSTTVLAATLDRAGVETDEGQTGRLVYARLTDPDPNFVQPGDFVTLRIPERPMDGVARLPSSALTSDGRLLVLGEGNRLEEVQTRLLRLQGDEVIVADVPFGKQYVTVRAQQLGAGLVVSPVKPAEPATAAAATTVPTAPETIALDEDRRAAIIAFIEASEQMTPDKRAQWLDQLNQPEVPIATVEKFEAKMAEGQ
ncbi:HlyD family efflux transporter periplasmic adaptor subunit [Mesobacterium sp. TK19101]|uniref:HlyD family efflux transporter periplasmic adaptor subunit n=1 Tax=Mesobacterium hydrothermale TaxID=3111907 RepID=A0ABU6HDJ7_9RHOB|nr:HlyD family efflux transporter periplasmic adaptor subunit [Mesobacterium sp. TK19101]MEC3860461.1 HlyD family efflux transporter periplasmic adaptor subunit [Mesobacterium sp. TK19101]